MDGWGAPVLATATPDPHPPAQWRPAASGSTACSRSGAAHRTTPEIATAVAVDDSASLAGPRCPRHASVVGDLACRHCRRLAGWTGIRNAGVCSLTSQGRRLLKCVHAKIPTVPD
ncbi:hypothetical protein VPH35_002700 [Triticum aestivum]